jgi:hypothetical protein
MTGYPEHNFPAFHAAAETLRERGYSVCSPAETDGYLGIGELTHEQYLRFDFERVLEADFLVALAGWEHSLGALAELMVAIRVGTKAWRWDTFDEYDLITYDNLVRALAETHGRATPSVVDNDARV